MKSTLLSVACCAALSLTIGCGYEPTDEAQLSAPSADSDTAQFSDSGGLLANDSTLANARTTAQQALPGADSNVYATDAPFTLASLLKDRTVLFAGQSNAAAAPQPGFEESAGRYNVEKALTWNGQWQEADPTLSGHIAPGVGVLAGAFSYIMHEKYGVDTRMLGRPWPGAKIELMLPDTPHYAAMRQDVYDSGYEPAVMLWHQGESDGVIGTSADEYTKMLNDMVQAWFEDYSSLEYVVIFQIAEGACGAPQTAVRIAQKRIADIYSNVLLANMDDLDPATRYDGCHYNLTGYDRHAMRAIELLEMAL